MPFASLDSSAWVTIIGAVFLGLTSLVTAVVTMILTHLERRRAAEREDRRVEAERQAMTVRESQGKQIQTVATDIRKVELATNSMKDALVRATGDAARAEGKLEERTEERARVAAKDVLPAVETLTAAIAEVPDLTAERVVEKIKGETTK